MNISKEGILSLLEDWIKQRPGLDPRNYISGWNDKDGRAAYNSEVRHITQQLHDARELLRAVEWSSIEAPALLEAFRAYSGRLQITETGTGGYRLDYCAGQYWPTEYRAAACAVLASALWDHYRPDHENADRPGDSLRAFFRRKFGASIQKRWFD